MHLLEMKITNIENSLVVLNSRLDTMGGKLTSLNTLQQNRNNPNLGTKRKNYENSKWRPSALQDSIKQSNTPVGVQKERGKQEAEKILEGIMSKICPRFVSINSKSQEA